MQKKRFKYRLICVVVSILSCMSIKDVLKLYVDQGSRQRFFDMTLMRSIIGDPDVCDHDRINVAYR